uniref:RNA-directed DNA polymerase n=1 Tax=Strigamia maritima TaxID=126957 RepID=T1ILJ7_STRMM
MLNLELFQKKYHKPKGFKNLVQKYSLDGEMLVFFFPTDDEEIEETGNGFKAVIPPSLRRRVLFACHGHLMSGHFGISKTAHRTRLLYHWKGLRKELRKYVRDCQHCQQYKPVQKKPTARDYTPHNMTAPWETMALNLMGPKPAGKNQLRWLLIIIDHCTKYVELFALRKATGTNIAEKDFKYCLSPNYSAKFWALLIEKCPKLLCPFIYLIYYYVVLVRAPSLPRFLLFVISISPVLCRHGNPKKILSDNGPQFISKNFTRTLISPYHPQANPTERANRNLKMLIAIFTDVHTNWPRYIHDFAFASRTALSEATGHTTLFLNTGRIIPPPWGPRLIGFAG